MADYMAGIRSGETGEKFAAFFALLSEYNRKINLSRITGREECDVKHFYDSLAGEKFFPRGASCIEIGSGGGFPSVPLLIWRPDLSFVLVESVGKKCSFLERAAAELGLNARVVNGRAEELAKDPAYREQYGVSCARAVARMNTLSEYCIPFVKVGGVFVAYKGDAAAELAEAENAFRVLGARLKTAERFELPEGAGERTVAVCEKVKPTPAAYPRGRGKERSKPL